MVDSNLNQIIKRYHESCLVFCLSKHLFTLFNFSSGSVELLSWHFETNWLTDPTIVNWCFTLCVGSHLDLAKATWRAARYRLWGILCFYSIWTLVSQLLNHCIYSNGFISPRMLINSLCNHLLLFFPFWSLLFSLGWTICTLLLA